MLPNVWLGVSVESRAYFSRIRHLQRTPAAVRFLSCEPLLAPLPELPLDGIGWVIVGGESGRGARPLELSWVHDIRHQCRAAGVSCFVKQLGSVWAGGRGKGEDPALWPDDLRVRELPGGSSTAAPPPDGDPRAAAAPGLGGRAPGDG